MDSSSSDTIRLNISSQDGTEVRMRTKRNLPLMKVFKIYCSTKQLEYKTIVFLYDGNRVNGRKTPAMLHMRDGDTIEALGHQSGGGRKGF